LSSSLVGTEALLSEDEEESSSKERLNTPSLGERMWFR
jgi:hypothetical protein